MPNSIPTLYVKKIWSLNPTKYKFINLDLALEKYSRYLFTIHDYDCQGKTIKKGEFISRSTKEAKTFKQWCTTEI